MDVRTVLLHIGEAARPRVDERGQLRQLLLSALAPCLDGCTKETSSVDLNQRGRGFLQDRASIFSIENLTGEDGEPSFGVARTPPVR
jgi:hypothetical protein